MSALALVWWCTGMVRGWNNGRVPAQPYSDRLWVRHVFFNTDHGGIRYVLWHMPHATRHTPYHTRHTPHDISIIE